MRKFRQMAGAICALSLLVLQVKAFQAQAEFRPPSDATVELWLQIAEKIQPKDLDDPSLTEGVVCRVMPGLGTPEMKAVGKDFKEAQARAGVKCIRYRCSFDRTPKEVEKERAEVDCKYDVEAVRVLMAAGLSRDEAVRIAMEYKTQAASKDAYRAMFRCDQPLWRIAAYDFCFGVPFECGPWKK